MTPAFAGTTGSGFEFQTATASSERSQLVITGLDPVIHLLLRKSILLGWMPGSSPSMTTEFASSPATKHMFAFSRRDASEVCQKFP
jgi:hypothetical protein